MDDMMTTNETARFAHVSPQTLGRWRAERTGPRWFRIGRKVLYRRRDVELWLGERYAAVDERERASAGA